MAELPPKQHQFQLLTQRRFLPYFITQFLGAFNDNVYKNALVILIAFQGINFLGFDSNTLINLSTALLIFPFFIFSATAGQFSDKYEKSKLIQKIKLLEVAIMLLAAIGFYFNNVGLLLFVLLLLGFQSTLFGPIKYSILPQHLRQEELVGGNGLVETGTFLAILIGTIIGGLLISFEKGTLIVSFAIILFAILGYVSSLKIPDAPPASPDLKINWNIISATWQSIGYIRESYTIFQSIMAISWFWFYGALYLSQIPNYTKVILGGNEQVVTLLLAMFSIGIGFGSLLCERFSGHKVEIGLVPFGAIGMTLFSILLASIEIAPPVAGHLRTMSEFLQLTGGFWILINILLLGTFSGFFIVPLYALIQQRCKSEQLSRVIAGNNIINALFIVGSAIVAIALLGAGLTIPQLFFVAALMNAAVSIYIFTVIPEFFMRFLVWIFIHTVYRVEKSGLENIPDKGAAILICNHVSYFDALVIAGCVRRPLRFVMYYKIYQIPILNFIFRTGRAIPIAGAKENKVIMENAFLEVDKALKAGEIVCIFPEGAITRDGALLPFKRGIERILENYPVSVIPSAICGLWGSIFSLKKGDSWWEGLPRYPLTKIAYRVGMPIPPEQVNIQVLEKEVSELRGEWH